MAVSEFFVRTLTGDSIVVSLAADSTVEHLKLLLKNSFSPASDSPSFHLFFKGVKLRMKSKLDVLDIGSGDFILLVPFTRKNLKVDESDQSNASMLINNENPVSKFTDSVWSEMMEDLSYLRDKACSEDSIAEVGRFNVKERGEQLVGTDCSETSQANKRKKGNDSEDLILDMLRSCKSKSVLDEENRKRLVEVLGSLNCLSDPYSGDCMLLRKSNTRGFGVVYETLHTHGGSSCMCPVWLKVILKAFSFLNVVYTIMELRRERTTVNLLEEVLGQIGTFGVGFGMKDLENLSVLSPKVVHFASEFEDEISSTDGIIVYSSTPKVQVRKKFKSGSRRLDVVETTNALKQRENSFRTSLWEAAESFMFTRGTEKIAFSSVVELFPFVKNRDLPASTSTSCNERIKSSRSSVTSSFHSKRCHVTNALSPLEMVEHLRKGAGSQGQIAHMEDIGSRKAIHVEIPSVLSQSLITALKHIGVTKLYSHQAEAVEASLAGKNVVVSTMTSSGKSLCYNLPVLEVLSRNVSSCALYLFPTKALAQDQLRALYVMKKELDCGLNIGIYDGDTPQVDRKWLRDNARLLITNPDMLHLSILPYHKQFGRILSNLRFVVVDEAHAYKGAFGCHTAFILRRLQRLCKHVYGSDLSFVFCTATSANPREHCMELANLREVELIQKDGSPSARKLFVLWNPFLNRAKASKIMQDNMDTGEFTDENSSSANDVPLPEMAPDAHQNASEIAHGFSSPKDISVLFAEMVQHGLRCIAFCKTRKLCELVLCNTREILQETAPHLVDSICAYRAGYIAEDRRRIERDFFGGKLCGVAATNALELGIDVGHIDVTLHLGFPGSIASLWQQAGRAGRRERPSLSVYVAFESPLDQYFMNNPRKLFGCPIECCHVDAQNQQVLEQHVVLAALEHPISFLYDESYFGSSLSIAVVSLKNKGCLISNPSCDFSSAMWNYIGKEKVPSRAVSIRAIETERYHVIDENTKEILEEIEESKAFFQVYEGAVYMHQGKSYLVKSLSLSSKIALCKVADLKYYTKTRDYTDIEVVGGRIAYRASSSESQISRTNARADPCKVTTTWFGFFRLDKKSHEIVDAVDLELPKYSYNSQAVWAPVPQSIKQAVEANQYDFRAGLHAASHALLNVVPLRIICNLSDLASECANPQDTRYFPERILLYDKHPGGIGMSVQIQPVFKELLISALELLTSCHCQGATGCPHCIQSFACKEYNEVLHKKAAIMIIKGVLEAEEEFRHSS